MLEIGDQPARRGERRAREVAEPVQCRDAEQPLEPASPPALSKSTLGRVAVARSAKAVASPTIVSAGFSRAISAATRSPSVSITSNRPVEISAQAIATPLAASPIATHQLALRLSSKRFLGQRSRGHDADDRAVDQCLGAHALARLLRRLGLLGDGDAVAGLDQAGEIAVHRVRRHAAHRDALAVMLAARGERDIEAGAGDLRIVEEQFEEIAHAIE
jgi:hypothetical protein